MVNISRFKTQNGILSIINIDNCIIHHQIRIESNCFFRVSLSDIFTSHENYKNKLSNLDEV